ncbi:hypothetical protein [Nannocystis pusilla]|uniref:hypothetical protein n=1 Tax=Nannocystis pusilla TaxID=889268 RepID=UPI003DA58005
MRNSKVRRPSVVVVGRLIWNVPWNGGLPRSFSAGLSAPPASAGASLGPSLGSAAAPSLGAGVSTAAPPDDSPSATIHERTSSISLAFSGSSPIGMTSPLMPLWPGTSLATR